MQKISPAIHAANERDAARFQEVLQHLYTPVIGDILDTLGKSHQFLPAQMRAAAPGMRLVGRAMPAIVLDVFGPQETPFGLLTQSLDQLQAGEIYVCGGGLMRCAYWGELLTATARMRKANGAVIHGYHRDTTKMLEQNWPVFSHGAFGQDSSIRSKIADYRCPVEIGGVHVAPGDLIFGDVDGVVVVPQSCEDEVIRLALEKAQGENVVRNAIEAGMSSTEALAKYKIL